MRCKLHCRTGGLCSTFVAPRGVYGGPQRPTHGTARGSLRKELLMPARLLHRITLAVVFAVVLSQPVAAGNSSLASQATPQLALELPGGHVLSRVWDWLRALGPLHGCSADPSGHCTGVAQGQRVRPQNGCSADPDGQKCVGTTFPGSRR